MEELSKIYLRGERLFAGDELCDIPPPFYVPIKIKILLNVRIFEYLKQRPSEDLLTEQYSSNCKTWFDFFSEYSHLQELRIYPDTCPSSDDYMHTVFENLRKAK